MKNNNLINNIKFVYKNTSRRVKALIGAGLIVLGVGTGVSIKLNSDKDSEIGKKSVTSTIELENGILEGLVPILPEEEHVHEHSDAEEVIETIASAPVIVPDFVKKDESVSSSIEDKETPEAKETPDATITPTPTPKTGNNGNGGVNPIPTVPPKPSRTPKPTPKPHEHDHQPQEPRYEYLGNDEHVEIIDYKCLEDGHMFTIRKNGKCNKVIITYNDKVEFLKCNLCGHLSTRSHKPDAGAIYGDKKVISCLNPGCEWQHVEVISTPSPKPTPTPTATPTPTPKPTPKPTDRPWIPPTFTPTPTATPTPTPSTTPAPHIHDYQVTYDENGETWTCSCGDSYTQKHTSNITYGEWVSDNNGKHHRDVKTDCETCSYSKDSVEEADCNLTTVTGNWTPLGDDTHTRTVTNSCDVCSYTTSTTETANHTLTEENGYHCPDCEYQHNHNSSDEEIVYPDVKTKDYCYEVSYRCSKDGVLVGGPTQVPHNYITKPGVPPSDFGDILAVAIICQNCKHESVKYVPKTNVETFVHDSSEQISASPKDNDIPTENVLIDNTIYADIQDDKKNGGKELTLNPKRK